MPLLSNGSCIFVYLAIVVQQRVYMLHYGYIIPRAGTEDSVVEVSDHND
jgi:hypothetical protein